MVVTEKDSNCLFHQFRKDSRNVINAVKICSQTEKQNIIGWRSMMNYFNKKREMQNSK